MVKKINKRGFTLAEALIAMLLVAVIAAGIITALMATKRAIVAPSNREDMIMAIEHASTVLQGGTIPSDCAITNDNKFTVTPPCDENNTVTCCNLNNVDTWSYCHNIDCLLPLSCSGDNDHFVYSVSEYDDENSIQEQKVIRFKIQCEGQTI